MEDRITAGLYLELIASSDTDAESRVAEVLTVPGVELATWWENLVPNRDDWLGEVQKLDEFELLAIYEVDEDFAPPRAPDGIRGMHYRRYPRPSQGVLRLPSLGLSLVLISPKDRDDEAASQALRDWGDFIHFPGIVDSNIPGYGLVTPYEAVTPDAPRYMHFYEFPDAEAEAVFQRTLPCLERRFDGGPGSPGFDRWVGHPQLDIDYVNSFRRLGVRSADSTIDSRGRAPDPRPDRTDRAVD